MPRLPRLVAPLLSLLLVAVFAILFIRGLFTGDMIRWTTSDHSWVIQSVAGQFHIWRTGYEDPAMLDSYRHDAAYRAFPRNQYNPGSDPWRRLGFHYERFIGGYNINNTPSTGTVQWFSIPHWLPTLLLAAIATLVTRRYIVKTIRHHRQTQNRCPTCGYDIRATPDRCPECGRET